MNHSVLMKKKSTAQAPCILLLTLLIMTVFFSIPVCAETRQHKSHVHGIGKLNIALSGHELFVELESPAANIVGFEHAPSTQVQKDAVHAAEEQLKDGPTLFNIPVKAQCTQLESHVSHTMMRDEHEKDRHDSHHHEHKAHEHHNDHSHTIQDTHSEFHTKYRFQCKSVEKLTTIDVKLFSLFPGFEILQVQMLSPKGQTAHELTPASSTINL